MNEKHEQLLSEVRNYVTEIFNQELKPHFVFHTIEHTEDVVEACSIMADHYKLSEDDRLVLLLAAWLHDTGYVKGEAAGHEEESIQIATRVLQGREVDPVVVQRVNSCIKATRMPQSPVTLVEQILCDGDLYHLATADFRAKNELLKQEREALLGQKIAKKEWRRNNIQFLETHTYFTDYARERLEPRKQENLVELRGKKERKQEEKKAEAEELYPYVSEPNPYSEDKNDIKAQQKNTERGVQTMFRTTSNNHFELSSLADSKSNIMISVNAIIISVSLTVLIARLRYYPQYIIPTILLLAVCLSAVIFAILATRPSVNAGRFTEEDIRNKRTNLLFFGNFHRMKLEEYQWAMNEMLKDREYLYNSMIKDIYFLGVVLAKKYRYLRISYTIFMWGLIIAVIAFAIAFIYGSGDSAVGTGTGPIDY